MAVVAPATFLKLLWTFDHFQVKACLLEQAANVRVPINHLLDNLSKSVPTFIAEIRNQFD
jgi:hypothetical protein